VQNAKGISPAFLRQFSADRPGAHITKVQAIRSLAMGKEVEPFFSNPTLRQVRIALQDGWFAIEEKTPGKEATCLLMAQWAIETAEGKRMPCYNLAGIKAKKEEQDQYDYCYTATTEELASSVAARWIAGSTAAAPCEKVGENPKKGTITVLCKPKHSACCFKAFPSLEEGAKYYVGLLKKKYKSAWSSLATGDPNVFAHALGVGKFFTGDETVYASLLRHYYLPYMNSKAIWPKSTEVKV